MSKVQLTTRKCTECKKSFQARGRQLTCSRDCRLERLQGQLRVNYEKIKAEKAAKDRSKNCLHCKNKFTPNPPQTKYCSDQCKVNGLLTRIEEQRVRRAAAKAERLAKKKKVA